MNEKCNTIHTLKTTNYTLNRLSTYFLEIFALANIEQRIKIIKS